MTDASTAARSSHSDQLEILTQTRILAEKGLTEETVDIFQRSASYVDRILKGANPGDLPVQAPNKFELAINVNTARRLGLDLPPTLLGLADEVIE